MASPAEPSSGNFDINNYNDIKFNCNVPQSHLSPVVILIIIIREDLNIIFYGVSDRAI